MSERLDAALVRRGLARSRGQAAELISEGRVRLDGRVVHKASLRVPDDAALETDRDPYVSRAAHKLLGALDDSGTEVHGRALDAGASTGGFTQVLLERGCRHVHAVDVGHGQLAPTLRRDPRVCLHEGVNLRDLTLEHVGGEAVDVLVADVSFISLTLLLPPMLACLRADGVALLLVKPQFEAGRAALDSHGVVTDARVREDAVARVADAAAALGWSTTWRGESALPGGSGNRETFLRLGRVAHAH